VIIVIAGSDRSEVGPIGRSGSGVDRHGSAGHQRFGGLHMDKATRTGRDATERLSQSF
jgi:hypothetical protein